MKDEQAPDDNAPHRVMLPWEPVREFTPWVPGISLLPIGLLVLTFMSNKPIDGEMLLWAGAMAVAPLLVVSGAFRWRTSPASGKLLVWMGLSVATMSHTALLFIGLFSLFPIPVGLVGLFCCFGVGDTMKRAKTGTGGTLSP